jgi:hypothetical protein
LKFGDELGTRARRAVSYRELLVDVAEDEWVPERTQAWECVSMNKELSFLKRTWATQFGVVVEWDVTFPNMEQYLNINSLRASIEEGKVYIELKMSVDLNFVEIWTHLLAPGQKWDSRESADSRASRFVAFSKNRLEKSKRDDSAEARTQDRLCVRQKW